MGGGDLEFHNLALGSTSAIQNLYELKRNFKLFLNAKLIITESNINEMQHHFHPHQKLSYTLIYRYLNWFYNELYSLKKKILVLILPYQNDDYKTIDNMHKCLCMKFGFNLIDMQKFYEENELVEFGRRIDSEHQLARIMCELGRNILKNIDEYQMPKNLDFKNDNPVFKICTPKDMILLSGNLEEKLIQNSAFSEKTYKINNKVRLGFKDEFKDYCIVGIHTWNQDENIKLKNWTECCINYSSIILQNKTSKFSKEASLSNQFIEVQKAFLIDDESCIKINDEASDFSEFHRDVLTLNDNAKQIECCSLIAFFCAKNDGNFYEENIDFKAFALEHFELAKEYDFNHLIPNIKLYKEIIDEYCAFMDLAKLAPLQNEIKALKDKINITNSAKARIKNHLHYKLGQAMIKNSKSLFGYIRMPFVLSYIKDEHKKEQKAYKEALKANANLALPSLESYEDYKEALKIKEYLSYRLGEALVKAYKTWYKGGFVKFLFRDLIKINKEFKKKKNLKL